MLYLITRPRDIKECFEFWLRNCSEFNIAADWDFTWSSIDKNAILSSTFNSYVSLNYNVIAYYPCEQISILNLNKYYCYYSMTPNRSSSEKVWEFICQLLIRVVLITLWDMINIQVLRLIVQSLNLDK